jgi:hypothetical protein
VIKFVKNPLVAINVPWPTTASGFVEWRLVDWTVEGDGHPRYPVLDDGSGDTEAWGDLYAVEHDGGWKFPDGKTCDDAGLAAAFKRREAKH